MTKSEAEEFAGKVFWDAEGAARCTFHESNADREIKIKLYNDALVSADELYQQMMDAWKDNQGADNIK